MKLIGALGVILAGTCMGILAVMRLHRRRDLLAKTILWLSDLERRLSYTLPPLRDFLEETAKMPEYAALTFIPAVLRELDRTDMAAAFSITMREEERQGRLSSAETALLCRLGSTLGTSDAKTQLRCVGECTAGLRELWLKTREKTAKADRLYVTLGAGCGMAVAVLLL